MKLVSSTIEAIDRNNLSLMGRMESPGMVFGIVSAGEMTFVKGYGVSRTSDPAAEVTADTTFRIASISKLFTAITVMRLVEQGKLELDDPIEKHLKSFRVRQFKATDPPITIRHLLTHTSGLGEFAPLLGYLPPFTLFGVNLPRWPLPKLSRLYPIGLRPDRSPGEAWAYANHGFATLGQIIADVMDEPFPNVVRKVIFDPLGMENSDFLRSDRVTADLAKGYKQIGESYWPVLDLDIITLADGSLFTTANDFGKFLGEITLGGGTIISKASLSQMMKPQYQLDNHLPAMGLGFFIENRKQWRDQLVTGHTGLWLGFHSSVMIAPAHQVATFAFVNDAQKTAFFAATNGMNQLLPKLDTANPEPTPAVDRGKWPELVGTYQLPWAFNSNFRIDMTFGRKFFVYLEDNKLKIRTRRGAWRKGVTLLPVPAKNKHVFNADGRYLVFHMDPAGKVDCLLMRFHKLFKL